MWEEAVAWAESVVGEAADEVVELSGGLTSTMLALDHRSGERSVLRVMTVEPWRTHGAELTRRERATQIELQGTPVPAPVSLGLDADGAASGVAAHLMSRLPGVPTPHVDGKAVVAMAEMLAMIHDVPPTKPFREYQSWAWEAKWVVPAWTRHPDAWTRAFDVLAQEPPAFTPTFLHRDFSHRNLLWTADTISGVVDWVETSIGPADLDAAHAATNLALAYGPELATSFLTAYETLSGANPDPYWLVMDAVGFLPARGKKPLFNSDAELKSLDAWLEHLTHL